MKLRQNQQDPFSRNRRQDYQVFMKHHSDLLKSSRRTTCPTRAEDFTEPRRQKNGSGSPVTTMKSVPSVEFGAHISSLGSPRYYKNKSGQ